MDPKIDPKKAKRILANRLSAAKSTLKKKLRIETLTNQIDALMQTRSVMESEVAELEMRFCAEVQRNAELKRLMCARYSAALGGVHRMNMPGMHMHMHMHGEARRARGDWPPTRPGPQPTG